MNIDGITSGVVIDHITAGKSMAVYRYLHLDQLECPVAIIKHVKSSRLGKKDIIKIDDASFDIDLDALGYLEPGSTVNIIRDGRIAEKKHPALPQRLVNVIRCKNPRCITSTEQELVHEFRLVNPEKKIYRCVYCDSAASRLPADK